MMMMMMMQASDEGSDVGVGSVDPWMMTTEAMVTSFCESADNALAMMQQHTDKAIVTNHLRLRHNDVIEFRVSDT